MSIDNIHLKTRCNQELRPMADNLASLCLMSDAFISRFTDSDILQSLSITPQMLASESMPTEEECPDEVILDGSDIDGRPILTRRKVLQLIRIILQLNGLKNMEQYGISKYTQSVALSICVNVKG